MNHKKMGIRIALATTLLSALAMYGPVLADTATTTTATTTNNVATTTYKVMIMEHLCNANVKSLSDFQALEANKEPIPALANTVFNCPTTGLPGTMAVTDSAAAPRVVYNFQLKNSDNSQIRNLNSDGMFMPSKVCESDVNTDVNGNGSIATSTCLDISHYELSIVGMNDNASSTNGTSTAFSVVESGLPSGYHFGTLRFTPNALMANNDSASLTSVNTDTGTINLNLATDTDKMIMLHVYNFLDATSTPTTTPPVITPPSNDHQAIMDMLKAIQTTLANLQSQIQMLVTKIGVDTGNGGNNGGGNNGGGTLFTHAAAHAAVPSAVIGDTNDFAGDHFQPYEQVTMSLDGQVMMTMSSDKEGNWHTGSIRLPLTPGTKTYTFRGLTSGAQVNVNVQVNQIP